MARSRIDNLKRIVGHLEHALAVARCAVETYLTNDGERTATQARIIASDCLRVEHLLFDAFAKSAPRKLTATEQGAKDAQLDKEKGRLIP